eukprot:COSAG02_NODE_11676_length_1676_cov_1.033608_1_plen_215_part_00
MLCLGLLTRRYRHPRCRFCYSELYGFSVLLPHEVDPTLRLQTQLLEAILRLAEEATGVAHNVETGEMGTLPVAGQSPRQYLLYSLLGKDPAFEEAVQHPKLLSIMEYYLGTDCVLNNVVSFIKKGGEVAEDGVQLGLHIDPHGGGTHGSHNALMQMTEYPHVFNSAWCLTDYTLENGAIAVVRRLTPTLPWDLLDFDATLTPCPEGCLSYSASA